MKKFHDGPATAHFFPLTFHSNTALSDLVDFNVSPEMIAQIEHAPRGDCVAWGLPFQIDNVIALHDKTIAVEIEPTLSQWLVFMHTSDLHPAETNPARIISPMRGEGQLGEPAANYVIQYADGAEISLPIRRRFQIGAFRRRWGENCFEAVVHRKPRSVRPPHEQLGLSWGWSQTRVNVADSWDWENWLWAWENPHPEKKIVGIRFEPVSGFILVSGISAGNANSNPLRWNSREKAVLTLPDGEPFNPELDENGQLSQIKLDLGQVISATRRPVYPNDRWTETYNNQLPLTSENEILIEYTAHPEAGVHLLQGEIIPVKEIISPESHPSLRLRSALALGSATQDAGSFIDLQPVAVQNQRVQLKVIKRGSGKAVPVKLHIHGEMGEYLTPVDRHRIPNPAWFEDYSVDFVHGGDWGGGANNPHYCTYIPGETTLDLPLA